MPERSKQILRLACFVLAALVVYELADVVVRINPLARVKIPALPSLPPDTNAPAAVKRTNAPEVATRAGGATNQGVRVGTNAMAGTNAAAMAAGTNVAGTNAVVAKVATNMDAEIAAATNGSNGTNGVNGMSGGANTAAGKGTNLTASVGTNGILPGAATNAGSRADGARAAVVMASGGPNAGPRLGGGGRGTQLSPGIQARVDRIAESEILGAVIRPPPMALLGIAGNYAFLRTPSGQSGLVKLGDELGGIKLLVIGTNHVLVEEQGQKKELTIFSGFGGESLLPKPETPK